MHVSENSLKLMVNTGRLLRQPLAHEERSVDGNTLFVYHRHRLCAEEVENHVFDCDISLAKAFIMIEKTSFAV